MHIIFNNVEEDYHNYLKFISYKKNQIIFNENQLCQTIGLVLKGHIQINTYTFYDKEYNIINIFDNGTFGENLLFSDNPIYLGDVVCIKDTHIAFIEKKDLITLMQKDHNFLINFLNIISNKGLNAQARIKLLMQKTVRDKILFYLFTQAKKFNTNYIKIKSKQQLSLLLNIPRPSLSRELILMKQDGLIDYGRYYITLIKSP